MLMRRPTTSELRATFDKVLTGVRDGSLKGCPSDTGLDDQTVTALDRMAQGKATAVQARVEFARMLDGTHARQARQRIERNSYGQS